MRALLQEFKRSVIFVLAFLLISCGIYPLTVFGIAQVLFPHEANGSLIIREGKIVGSELLAQSFSDPKYFHPRPSFAGAHGYDSANSGAGNQGPISESLIIAVEKRIADYRAENNLGPKASVPADAITASASGLDPHISVNNAIFQARRVASVRGVPERTVLNLMKAFTEGRDLGILGDPRVNVIKLNLALDRI